MLSALRRSLFIFLAFFLHLSSSGAPAERPFGIIFQMGYAGDRLPQDPASFEKLLLSLKEAHYNVVLCKHEPWREELCRKHKMLMMVDLLVADHHVYKNAEGAEKLCRSLRKSDAIYAYHLWSDQMGSTIKGRNRDLANVRSWDPNHATYLGDRNARDIGGLQNPDLIGYYDFHWQRGGHWRHLLRAHAAAKKTKSQFLKYVHANPGKVGVGNYNRVLYTLSMSVACGLKGYTYHYVGPELDAKTWAWQELGKDLARANAVIAPLGPELIKLGQPTAIYSTPITKTAKNRPTVEAAAVPGEFQPIPAEAPLQVAAGEAVVGRFAAGEDAEVYALANHNAYEAQAMKVSVGKGVQTILHFDRSKAKWIPHPNKGSAVSFSIPPAGVELIKVMSGAGD